MKQRHASLKLCKNKFLFNVSAAGFGIVGISFSIAVNSFEGNILQVKEVVSIGTEL